jgi:hypothetical protein
MKKLIIILMLFSRNSYAESFTTPLEAVCDDTQIVTKRLFNTFGEVPIIRGLTSDVSGTVMTMWLNPKDSSWTILATKDKITCVIGYGKDFKLLEYKTKPSV